MLHSSLFLSTACPPSKAALKAGPLDFLRLALVSFLVLPLLNVLHSLLLPNLLALLYIFNAIRLFLLALLHVVLMTLQCFL